MRGLRTSIAAITAIIFAAAAPLAMAANAAYVNTPMDTVQATVNTAISNINTAHSPAGSGNVSSAINIPTVASAVNLINIQGAATGNKPIISGGGPSADTNVSIQIQPKGTGDVYLGGVSSGDWSLDVQSTGSAVNNVYVYGNIAANAPTVGAQGSDSNINLSVLPKGTGKVTLGAFCTVTGSTPQTCNGLRGIVTTGTLTTAAVTDASFVINDTSVAATSMVQCTDQGYSGTLVTNGEPVITTCVPGTGTITVHITNVHATNALNGTVQIGFAVLN